jgi:hypothetical protein
MHNFKELKVWKISIELLMLFLKLLRIFQVDIDLVYQVSYSDAQFLFRQILLRVVEENQIKNGNNSLA